MLEQILTSLSNGLSQSLGWALLAAFAWGVVSIVFSPCHLASVPLVVGFISTQEDASTGARSGCRSSSRWACWPRLR